jgi:acyl carrier protein
MEAGHATQDTLRDEVRAVVRDNLPKFTDALPEGADLFGYGLDSMALISLIVALEEKFGCQFGIEDLRFESFGTIDGITALVRAKLVALR